MMRVSVHGTHGHGYGSTTHLLRHLLRAKQELGLTDEQIAKLRTMALDYDRAAIRGNAEVMVAERELRSLMWDEKVELGTIETKVKEREALEAGIRIIGIKAKRDLMGVLTPEQRSKQKTLWEQRRHGYRGHMQKAESSDPVNAEELADQSTGETELSIAGIGPSAG